MAKEALYTDKKHTGGGSSDEQSVIAAGILFSATHAKDKARDNQGELACKAELISLADREEIKKAVASIDRLLSPCLFVKV